MKNKLIDKAIKSFGGKGKFKNVFNIAGYQSAVTKEFDLDNILSPTIARQHLDSAENILLLYGGCHWIKND
jgi:hypothetical protein